MVGIKGQTAVVTGASSGIGRATALRLAGDGANIVVTARRRDRLDALVKEIQDTADVKAIAVQCDVTDRAQVDAVADAAKNEFGSIDILINNAGIMPLSPVAKRRYDEWDQMIDVNIKGLLYAIGAVLPTMIEQNAGHIVNVSSVAGRNVFPAGAVYCGTKHAVHAISEGLRCELAQMKNAGSGVRVTIIAPGVVATELQDGIKDQETRDQLGSYIDAIDKVLQSEDIAESIAYAVNTPHHVSVNEILVRPTTQPR